MYDPEPCCEALLRHMNAETVQHLKRIPCTVSETKQAYICFRDTLLSGSRIVYFNRR